METRKENTFPHLIIHGGDINLLFTITVI